MQRSTMLIATGACIMFQACSTDKTAHMEHTAMPDDSAHSTDQVLAGEPDSELETPDLSPIEGSCAAPLVMKLPALDVRQPRAQLTLASLDEDALEPDFAAIECLHVVQGESRFIVHAGQTFEVNAHVSALQRMEVQGGALLIALGPDEHLEIAGNACFGWELRGQKFSESERRSPARVSLRPPSAWTQYVTLIDIGDPTTESRGVPDLLEPPATITPQRCGFHQVDTQFERVMLAVGFDETWTLSVDPQGKAHGSYKQTQ